MNRDEIGKIIWDRFAVAERLRGDFGKIYFPNKSFIAWKLHFSSKPTQENNNSIIEDLAFKRIVTPDVFINNQKIISLVRSVPDGELDLKEFTKQIPANAIKKGIKEFLKERNYSFEADGGNEIDVIIPADRYEVVVCFYIQSGFFHNLDYLVKVFRAGEIRKTSNIEFAFLAEYLWGCGSRTWDLIESDQILQDALSVLFDLCDRLAKVFMNISD